MSSQILEIAAEHLAMYSDVIRNGINGSDHLFPETIKLASHSPLYGYLANDELQHLVIKQNRRSKPYKFNNKSGVWCFGDSMDYYPILNKQLGGRYDFN